MIHANKSILDVQKFKYLVTSLSGNAAKIIESIELTDTNYTIAWELLEKRYDDPRAIKKKHIQCLFTISKVEKESAGPIRSLVDYTLKHLRVLKSLNLSTNSWSELIIHVRVKIRYDDVTCVRAKRPTQYGQRDTKKFNGLLGKEMSNSKANRSEKQGKNHCTKWRR